MASLAMKAEKASSLEDFLSSRLDAVNYRRLMAINNESVHEFVSSAIVLCDPEEVWISTDSPADVEHSRAMALKTKEEMALRTPGHTLHFDGPNDQGRDREVTRYLVPKDESLSAATIFRELVATCFSAFSP